MLVSGMHMGLSFTEAKSMSLTRLGNFIDAYNDLNSTDEDDGGVRVATQADIDSLI